MARKKGGYGSHGNNSNDGRSTGDGGSGGGRQPQNKQEDIERFGDILQNAVEIMEFGKEEPDIPPSTEGDYESMNDGDVPMSMIPWFPPPLYGQKLHQGNAEGSPSENQIQWRLFWSNPLRLQVDAFLQRPNLALYVNAYGKGYRVPCLRDIQNGNRVVRYNIVVSIPTTFPTLDQHMDPYLTLDEWVAKKAKKIKIGQPHGKVVLHCGNWEKLKPAELKSCEMETPAPQASAKRASSATKRRSKSPAKQKSAAKPKSTLKPKADTTKTKVSGKAEVNTETESVPPEGRLTPEEIMREYGVDLEEARLISRTGAVSHQKVNEGAKKLPPTINPPTLEILKSVRDAYDLKSDQEAEKTYYQILLQEQGLPSNYPIPNKSILDDSPKKLESERPVKEEEEEEEEQGNRNRPVLELGEQHQLLCQWAKSGKSFAEARTALLADKYSMPAKTVEVSTSQNEQDPEENYVYSKKRAERNAFRLGTLAKIENLLDAKSEEPEKKFTQKLKPHGQQQMMNSSNGSDVQGLSNSVAQASPLPKKNVPKIPAESRNRTGARRRTIQQKESPETQMARERQEEIERMRIYNQAGVADLMQRYGELNSGDAQAIYQHQTKKEFEKAMAVPERRRNRSPSLSTTFRSNNPPNMADMQLLSQEYARIETTEVLDLEGNIVGTDQHKYTVKYTLQDENNNFPNRGKDPK